ncbi:MAG: hypothetical protein HY646_15255 [Acidobacteria bacterium]|nr:hypothetical protein [Acidobacteriota bacterium]
MSPARIEEAEDEIAHLLVRIYEIHEIVIAETGGLPGLRDAALLHAAVARPFRIPRVVHAGVPRRIRLGGNSGRESSAITVATFIPTPPFSGSRRHE